MIDDFGRLMESTRTWFTRNHADGWINDASFAAYSALEDQTPADLFAQSDGRPLVVGLFGGTGVGKSSLLNRLAGGPVARVGVERPTSREVTVYAHRDLTLRASHGLPLEEAHIARHDNEGRRNVVWIDAPDIDSVETANREKTIRWLRHIDLLIYVASPERYRDDVGWRTLRERGGRHGWMFVLNHWDEGDPRQRDDWRSMLVGAGFDRPMLLCTSCAPGTEADDEFAQIEATIDALQVEHGATELERLGHRARLLDQREAVQAALAGFGDEARWTALRSRLATALTSAEEQIVAGMEWPLAAVAERFAERPLSMPQRMGNVGRALRAGSPALGTAVEVAASGLGSAPEEAGEQAQSEADMSRLLAPLWDDWSQDKTQLALDDIELTLRRQGLAPAPVQSVLANAAAEIGAVTRLAANDALREALARPGAAWRRLARRVTGFLMAFLPLVALLWVAYHVINGYYRASQTGRFLDGAFAIHSGLLVLIAWAAPFAIDRALRPAMRDVALVALRRGLRRGLEQGRERLLTAFDQVATDARERQAAGQRIAAELSKVAMRPVAANRPTLSRVLADPNRGPRGAGERVR